ncbi:MAG: AAA family ATPase [Endomicrobiia bacterium]
MKIAITGKGGTGKTTFSAMLGYLFSKEGKSVFFVDADPDGNLGLTLGFSQEELRKIQPISEMKELIAERTESTGAGYFKLNPRVDDIPEKFSLKKDNFRFLVLGTLKKGGAGCYCPENAFLKALLRNLLVQREEIVILDMPAGIEHLSRGTAESVDLLLIMVEPTIKSIQTTDKILKLAEDIRIKSVKIIVNKVIDKKDTDFVRENLKSSSEIIGSISFNNELHLAEKLNQPVYFTAKKTLKEVEKIKEQFLIESF